MMNIETEKAPGLTGKARGLNVRLPPTRDDCTKTCAKCKPLLVIPAAVFRRSAGYQRIKLADDPMPGSVPPPDNWVTYCSRDRMSSGWHWDDICPSRFESRSVAWIENPRIDST